MVYGLPRVRLGRAAAPRLRELELEPHTDRLLGTLSHGQRRRVHLAAALLPRPRLLAALRDAGAALLFASHDLASAEAAADRVVVVMGQRFAAAGTVEELRRSAGARSPAEAYLAVTGTLAREARLRELVAGGVDPDAGAPAPGARPA